MSANVDFDQVARAWLAEGPTELSDRVLEATLDTVRRTAQRHPSGVLRRFRLMSAMFKLAAAVIAVVVVSVIAFNLPASSPIGGPSPTPSASPSAVPSATPTARPTAMPKTPAATVQTLVDRVYGALHAHDAAALRALILEDAQHVVYYENGTVGSEVASITIADFSFDMLDVTRTGEPVVAGDLVVVPVRYTYADEVDLGFDVLSLVRAGGGLLVGPAATLYGRSDLTAGEAAIAKVQAEMAAWNKQDTAGVLATMTSDAQFWEGVAGPTRTVHSGPNLGTFVASTAAGITVAINGTPVTSGTFLAVPNHLTSKPDGATSDGVSVYDIRGGSIALQVYVQP